MTCRICDFPRADHDRPAFDDHEYQPSAATNQEDDQ